MESKVQKNTQRKSRPERSTSNLEERVIFVNRCSKVVKGGRRFSFSALVIVGDREGHAGYALGKAKEVSEAIRKGGELARRTLVTVLRSGRTLPHDVVGTYAGARVLLKPASPGTGVIAGGAARAFLELAGVRDVLAKSLGGSSPLNVTRATIDALSQLRTWDTVCRTRFGHAPALKKIAGNEAIAATDSQAVSEDVVV
jgi:small subunit ribosomal protein S5